MKRKRTITKTEKGKSMKRKSSITMADWNAIWSIPPTDTSKTSKHATLAYLSENRWSVHFWNIDAGLWCETEPMLYTTALFMVDLINYNRKGVRNDVQFLVETLPVIQDRLVNAKRINPEGK